MTIYGTALLSLSVLIGLSLGRYIGRLCQLNADIGGVGMAMLILVLGTEFLQRRGLMRAPTESGIAYWSSIYVPIVVAMAATQNVMTAWRGGAIAALAGLVPVAACFLLVRVIAKRKPEEPS